MADGSAVPTAAMYGATIHDDGSERHPPDPGDCLVCSGPASPAIPGARLCVDHLRAAAAVKFAPAPTATAPAHEPLVYYLRFGDRVKIGTTTNLQLRLTAIPHDELLATEPGGRDVERGRHKQFAAYRVTGEWFHHCPAIAEHITSLGR